MDYWVDISELKEEDKVSRVLTGLSAYKIYVDMQKSSLRRKLLCHWLPADSEKEDVPLHHHLLLPGRHVCHCILDQVKNGFKKR